MFHIGCHLSVSKGYYAMGKEALSIGANTFQFFTRNPRGGAAKDIIKQDADSLKGLMEENHFAPLLAHAPYTLNLASNNPQVREFGLQMMQDDILRMEELPCDLYNFHPGSNSKEDLSLSLEYIISALNKIITKNQKIIVLLETMSGKGGEIGRTFEELKSIIAGIEFQEKIGVCLDTCHVFDAGYDIVNDLDGVLTQFDKRIGLERLHAIHLNDSMNPMGSHKDRHQKIGKGYIGLDGMGRIINHPKLRHLPFLLETPNEVPGYAEEIKILKGLYKG